MTLSRAILTDRALSKRGPTLRLHPRLFPGRALQTDDDDDGRGDLADSWIFERRQRSAVKSRNSQMFQDVHSASKQASLWGEEEEFCVGMIKLRDMNDHTGGASRLARCDY